MTGAARKAQSLVYFLPLKVDPPAASRVACDASARSSSVKTERADGVRSIVCAHQSRTDLGPGAWVPTTGLLRRSAHYDVWSRSRKSLCDSGRQPGWEQIS